MTPIDTRSSPLPQTDLAVERFGEPLMQYVDALREAQSPEDLELLKQRLAANFVDPVEREGFLELCEANELLCLYLNDAL